LIISEGDILDAGVLHLVQNMSDHEVNFVKIKSDKIEVPCNRKEKKAVNAKRKWKSASEDNKLEYQDVLFRKLEVPDCITSCKDAKCQNNDHIRNIDEYAINVLTSINESAKEAIPVEVKVQNSVSKTCGKRKAMAGWKDFVEPFQKKAQFWHSIWLSAGKPVNTELHTIMKRTKIQFHYQIRRCWRVENYLVNQKICVKDDKDLFQEIKKQRSAGKQEEIVIDGAVGEVCYCLWKTLQ
jgi:hypothetical protein